MKKLLSIVGILLIIISFTNKAQEIIIEIEPNVRTVLNINEPSEELKKTSEPIAWIINKKNDREKFSIFNYEFSKRIPNYNGSGQKYNDVYVKAGELALKDSFKDYIGLKDLMIEYIKEITTDKDKLITEEEKQKLSEKFKALSWVLGE
jgi:aspartate 1-decarboxylase